jgi:hypothetical protein
MKLIPYSHVSEPVAVKAPSVKNINNKHGNLNPLPHSGISVIVTKFSPH